MILLPLSELETSAVAVALVGPIHDRDNGRWGEPASDVAMRLDALREADRG
jgi:hypothetical protein